MKNETITLHNHSESVTLEEATKGCVPTSAFCTTKMKNV